MQRVSQSGHTKSECPTGIKWHPRQAEDGKRKEVDGREGRGCPRDSRKKVAAEEDGEDVDGE